MSADDSPERVVLKREVDADAIDDAARFAGWRLTNVIPGDARHPRQLLFAVFEGGWLYLVDDARFSQRWFQAEGPRQSENLARVRSLLDCEAPGAEPAPAVVRCPEESDELASQSAPRVPHPQRPRLADHVLPRLHVMDDSAHLLLHDNTRGDALELDPEQFAWLELADGTRDEEGVYLEASRRGLLRKRSQIRELFRLLHERGELAGGIAGEQRVPRFEERPIRLLPGLQLGCDGNGSCCRTYSSMLFDAEEVEATRDVDPPGVTGRHARIFLPAFGTDQDIQAVATRDGACVFLGDDSSCALHPHGKKPRGCRDYPLTLVDDGDQLWAVPVFECPCVERSFLREIETSTVELPATEAGLDAERPITRLETTFRLTADSRLDLAELRSWVERGLAQIPEATVRWDPLHWLWSWAHDRENPPRTLRAPPSHAMAPWVQRLHTYATRRVQSATWRARGDRTRRLVEWMLRGSEVLLDPRQAQALLQPDHLPCETTPSSAERYARHRRAEWAYITCQLRGYQFAQGSGPLEAALEQRCVRLLLARAMLEHCPDASAGDPSRWSPLTALEALLRSESLEDPALR